MVGVTGIGVTAAFLGFGRRRWLCWGVTDGERDLGLPGDELIANPDLIATRAITIRASVDEVWPWIAQLGQGRGGFYSYDFFENLVGCDITARIGSCLNGRMSPLETRSGSIRRARSTWLGWKWGDRS